MSLDPAVPTSGRMAVCWGTESHAFELRTSDRAILAQAAVVFRPWALRRPPAPVRAWVVEPANGGGGWVVRGEGATDSVVTGPPRRVVAAIEYLALQALIERPPDVLTLHAALVGRGGRGALILGPGEAGKSTLACALWRHGFTLLGDDVAVVDSGTLAARSAPRRVSLRHPSRALLGEALWARIMAAPASERTTDGYVFHPDEVDGRPRPESVRLGACVFLGVRGGVADGPVAVRRQPAQAALALLPYSNLARRLDTGQVIARIAPLAAAVPVYDVGRGSLSSMISAVEGLLEGAS